MAVNSELKTIEERDPETHAIIGAAIEVHRELGCGFLEAVYQEALEIELNLRGIPNQREVKVPVYYKQCLLESFYLADFCCFDRILVELKAASQLTGVDESQLLNYLKGTRLRRGLLLNFGRSTLEIRRLVFDPANSTNGTIKETSSPMHPSSS